MRKEISDETDRETGRSKQISSVPIHLSIYSPNGKLEGTPLLLFLLSPSLSFLKYENLCWEFGLSVWVDTSLYVWIGELEMVIFIIYFLIKCFDLRWIFTEVILMNWIISAALLCIMLIIILSPITIWYSKGPCFICFKPLNYSALFFIND